jgi:2-methylcitrate dehydratase PrpD
MAIATELAKRIVAMNYADLPPEAVHWAKIAFTDLIGSALVGVDEPGPGIVERVLDAGRAPGPSLLWGTNRRVSPLDAAVINGTLAHALDYDDCGDSIAGHPSVPLIPSVLALAESLGSSGHDVLLAYVTGFETQARIGRGAVMTQFEKGWHPTATFGVFGSAAANARLLKLNVEQTAVALSLAASMAAGIKANFGTMTKPLHAGQCSRHGLYAALLAKEGFTANAEAIEHKQGYLELFNGKGGYDADKILQDWAKPLDVLKPGIGLKQYPSCGSTHSAIDAMLSLRAQHGLTPDQVASIESVTHARALAHTSRPRPKSGLDAKFSVQYCVSRALLDGEVTLKHFRDETVSEPAVQKILERVTARPHAHQSTGMHDHFECEMIVKTTDGRTLTIKTDHPLRGPCNLTPPDKLESKFKDCAGQALRPEAIVPLYDAIRAMDGLKDIRVLTRMLEQGIKSRESVAA